MRREHDGRMRLDKFLQATGVFKRREWAKEACEGGKVLVNEAAARPAKEVAVGQVIEVETRQSRLRIEVLEVPAGNVNKALRARFIKVSEEDNTTD